MILAAAFVQQTSPHRHESRPETAATMDACQTLGGFPSMRVTRMPSDSKIFRR
jgi:hypothetical protein